MIRDVLSITNLILALLAVPPALYLTKVLIDERKIIKDTATTTNHVLTSLVIGVAAGSLLNAFLSLLSIVDNGLLAHNLSPLRSVLVNGFFTFVSWSLYLIHKYNIRK